MEFAHDVKFEEYPFWSTLNTTPGKIARKALVCGGTNWVRRAAGHVGPTCQHFFNDIVGWLGGSSSPSKVGAHTQALQTKAHVDMTPKSPLHALQPSFCEWAWAETTGVHRGVHM